MLRSSGSVASSIYGNLPMNPVFRQRKRPSDQIQWKGNLKGKSVYDLCIQSQSCHIIQNSGLVLQRLIAVAITAPLPKHHPQQGPRKHETTRHGRCGRGQDVLNPPCDRPGGRLTPPSQHDWYPLMKIVAVNSGVVTRVRGSNGRRYWQVAIGKMLDSAAAIPT
jgi:hypothetical protein